MPGPVFAEHKSAQPRPETARQRKEKKGGRRGGRVRLPMLTLLAAAGVWVVTVSAGVSFFNRWGIECTAHGQFTASHGAGPAPSGATAASASPDDCVPNTAHFTTKWSGPVVPDGAFQSPSGVAVDAAGNVYVADTINHRIQKFDSAGAFIGKWGEQGSGDGELFSPSGVAVDTFGNVYVADTGNDRIQKFDPDGAFVNRWGTGGTGDGEFKNPRGVAVDSAGNVYVADTTNHRVQKFDSSGVFITKWGNAGSSDGEFQSPSGVAVDAAGNVYVADTFNHRVQKFDSSGLFLATLGAAGSGDGQFQSPDGVAVDASGNVYVADTVNDRVQKFTADGAFVNRWGTGGTGDGQFDSPGGLAVDAAGNVYVADTSNNRIQKFDSSDLFLVKWGAQGTAATNLFGLAVDSSGNVYVADADNDRVQKFGPGGALIADWGASGTGDGEFRNPRGVAVDSAGNVYVADAGNHRIQKFTSAGVFLATLGMQGSGDGQLNSPYGVAVDSAGNVYVADTFNDRIQKFDSGGAFIARWGTGGTGDGQFKNPGGVAVDSAGNVYVTDSFNNRVQKFDSAGAFITRWGTGGTGDKEFFTPYGVAVDAAGSVYVADTFNDRVQKFGPGGALIANWGASGTGDGELFRPYGLAVDTSGNVYVADTGNRRIQKFSQTCEPRNAVPDAGHDPTTVVEDSGPNAVNVLANDTDADMDALTVVSVTQGAHGTVSITGGGTGVSYTPNADYYGPDNFTYTIEDSQGAADTATVPVTVTPVADTPSVTPVTTGENARTTSGLVISRSEVDGAEVTHFKITGITNGTLYQTYGSPVISEGQFITYAQGSKGLKFLPTAGLSSPGSTFGFKAQASTSDTDSGLGGSPATATVTVAEGGVLKFSASAYSAGEGAGSVTITVTRTGGSGGAASVKYAISNGSASGYTSCVAGRDYVAQTGTLSWAAGDAASKTFDITICPDTVYEGNETINLSLSNVTGSAILGAPSNATLTIADNEAQPKLSVEDVAVTEGDSGLVSGLFTVKLSVASNQTVTVKYATADGSATAPADYTALGLTTLTFDPGETSKQVRVVVKGDLIDEIDESFQLVLSSPTDATLAVSSADATITDDDAATISVGDVSVTETDLGSKSVTFTVTLSAPSSRIVTVKFQTANGTAKAPGDYTAVGLTALLFGRGQTTKTVTLYVKGDTAVEPAETFFVNLSAPVNATIADGQGKVTILNDD